MVCTGEWTTNEQAGTSELVASCCVSSPLIHVPLHSLLLLTLILSPVVSCHPAVSGAWAARRLTTHASTNYSVGGKVHGTTASSSQALLEP